MSNINEINDCVDGLITNVVNTFISNDDTDDTDEPVVQAALVKEVLGKNDYLKKIKSLEYSINLLKKERATPIKETIKEPIIETVREDKTPDIILIIPYRDRES